MISESHKPGQSLTEYALPIALVVLVGVGLLGALGSQLNGMFGNTIGSKSNPVQSNTTLASASTGASGIQVLQSGFVATPNSNTLAFDISENGKTVHFTIPNYPDSLKTGVETMGADGTTQSYATLLKKLADKLEEEGVLTPDKAQMIREIANSGFELSTRQAEVQKALADAPQNGGLLLFPDTRSDPPNLVKMSAIQALRFANPLTRLQDNFDKAKTSGALNNQILQRVVLDAVNNLKISGNSSSTYVMNQINLMYSGGMGNLPQYSKSDLNNFMIRDAEKQEIKLMKQAQTSAEESTKICDVSGKSKVKGLSCQPAQPKETSATPNALPAPTTSKPAPSGMGNLASDFKLKNR
ncbi:MAG: hypothetical protein K2X66_10375 [Cyanobacteria bacterium]|nr:hypothetical protein [Cyanobacteriota bacterium]